MGLFVIVVVIGGERGLLGLLRVVPLVEVGRALQLTLLPLVPKGAGDEAEACANENVLERVHHLVCRRSALLRSEGVKWRVRVVLRCFADGAAVGPLPQKARRTAEVSTALRIDDPVESGISPRLPRRTHSRICFIPFCIYTLVKIIA